MERVLFKYFPFLTWNDVIITSHKQLVNGDVLIDDGTHNLEGGNYFKILMTAQHNKKYDAEANGMLRVETWAEVYSAITLLAEEDDLKGWKEVPMAITLYSTGCPKCKVLKKKLEEKGIKYTENNSVDAPSKRTRIQSVCVRSSERWQVEPATAVSIQKQSKTSKRK